MELQSEASVADTVPGVMVMVPASTVMASAEVSSIGTGIQWDRMSFSGLKRMIIATCTLATMMSQRTTNPYSMILSGLAILGRLGQ